MNRIEAATATVEMVVQSLDADGSCIVEGMLSSQEVAAARSSLCEPLKATPLGQTKFNGYSTRRVTALFAKTRAFDRPAIHPLVLGVLDRLLVHYQLSAPMAIQIEPGEVEQVFHRDQGLYPLPPGFPEVLVNTMWAIDDFTVDNGATRLVPRSHGWEERVARDSDEVIYATMPAGSVLFMLGKLWHAGGANKTGQPRLGVILEYEVAWLRQQETHLLAVPREIAACLPERLQELLGYNVYPPVIGLVDGLHPRSVLTTSSQKELHERQEGGDASSLPT